MNITEIIKRMYPELEFFKDFKVVDELDGKGIQFEWYRDDIEKPTDIELDKAWKEIEKESNIEEIDRETSLTIFTKYSDNTQKNITRLAMVEIQKALKGESINQSVVNEANEMNDFIELELKKGQDKKDLIK